MIDEKVLLIASMLNIIIISVLVYKKKFSWAWALALIQALAMISL